MPTTRRKWRAVYLVSAIFPSFVSIVSFAKLLANTQVKQQTQVVVNAENNSTTWSMILCSWQRSRRHNYRNFRQLFRVYHVRLLLTLLALLVTHQQLTTIYSPSMENGCTPVNQVNQVRRPFSCQLQQRFSNFQFFLRNFSSCLGFLLEILFLK